jgi:small neutral amino acid transporter SnatA (MarC family)
MQIKELNKGRMQIKELNKRRLQRDKKIPMQLCTTRLPHGIPTNAGPGARSSMHAKKIKATRTREFGRLLHLACVVVVAIYGCWCISVFKSRQER